ncbi:MULTISPECIES: bifunctional 3-phenylpropionate/cinnamic acid dioxygenase ferredoxin subunit [unclassified Streptomyces]|uniref:bifunctional 3-phenylpropionate/cinnamic acid dioxygenase ferredoxin subunit n=1 Tax=unclassified Streptomyces TaxID=2593676 RepID=UPI002E10B658|nr:MULTISPECIES: bifunctional 3-phenylpropionate/cinnamic acid dioxygenase ferredoxin subunit [unclassified Streptomyces]WSR24339.1 bifunctional 3-phenylpropionate/cinnamic acid dioxygenase ferredoxin subunit [Streptomyces sp. NBC_01205]
MKIPVCRLADLPRGEACRLDSDPPIAVFHTEDGEVYAIDDTCTHQDASLSDGWLEGCEVECPLHASKFDLRTGAVDSPPAKRPVRTHQVLVEEGTVYVLPQDAPTGLPRQPPGAAVHRVEGRA